MIEDAEPRLNLLCAWPYMTRAILDFLHAERGDVRFLLDSGAFTAWKAGTRLHVDDYCRFVEGLPVQPWRYFTLDVVGDPDASLANYETMVRRGFRPVPIFTRGEDPSVLEDYYRTSEVVGVGGLVKTLANKGFVNGIMRRVGARKVHWLGFTDMTFLKAYRPYMCDSSSWASALQYASLKLYDRAGKSVVVQKSDFARKPPADVLRILTEYDLDPRVLAVAGHWKNSGRGDYPIETACLRSAVRQQLDIGRSLGTHLFMAVAQYWQAKLAHDAYRFWRDHQPALFRREHRMAS